MGGKAGEAEEGGVCGEGRGEVPEVHTPPAFLQNTSVARHTSEGRVERGGASVEGGRLHRSSAVLQSTAVAIHMF